MVFIKAVTKIRQLYGLHLLSRFPMKRAIHVCKGILETVGKKIVGIILMQFADVD
jgi:hypothetical protein